MTTNNYLLSINFCNSSTNSRARRKISRASCRSAISIRKADVTSKIKY